MTPHEVIKAINKGSSLRGDFDEYTKNVGISLLLSVKEMVGDGTLQVYLRSKQSQDCSRGENEEEKSVEMISLKDLQSLLDAEINKVKEI